MPNEKTFFAGVIDYNPKRMIADEAAEFGIPKELLDFVGDHRQYPLNISKHFPDGTAWFDTQQPWFFRQVMDNDRSVEKLENSQTLILSGSGMSAHKFVKGEGGFTPEDKSRLARSQELIIDFLGQGKWILGICFGGQLAMSAVGADIGRLPSMENGETVTEAGWLEHQLTDEAKSDEVFSLLAQNHETFYAPHLHNDYVAKLPTVGTKIETKFGLITVVESQVLAIRKGYLGNKGLENATQEYIQASVVTFDNGARLYQIQPHPEMATPDKANFLVRKNPWISKEMGDQYYEQALQVPDEADHSVSRIITQFVNEARKHLEEKHGQVFADAVVANNLHDYLIA